MDKKNSNGIYKDLKSIRYQNQKRVFDILRKRDCSCKDLSAELEISNVSVYDILKKFAEKEIIVATTIKSDFGRKPVAYSLNSNYGYFAIFDLTPPLFHFGLYNLRGQSILHRSFPLVAPVAVENIISLIKEIIAELEKEGYFDKIRSVGVSVSGRINPKTDYFIASATFIDAQNVNIKALFEKFFPCRIYVKNNIALALINELNTPECEEIQNCIYLYINTSGIGGAVLLNGKIWNGNNNFAGEISAFLINEKEPLFLALSEEVIRDSSKEHYDPDIIEKYNRNDAEIPAIIEKHLYAYHQLITNSLLLLDCDNVIINSRLTQKSAKARAALTQSIEKEFGYFSSPRIIFSDKKDDIFLEGCLNYVISKSIMHLVREED